MPESNHPPSNINPRLRQHWQPVGDIPIPELAAQIQAGDRVALARAITLVESTRPADQAKAQALIGAVLPATGGAFRLGITGSPGVGKSTFVEAFGQYLVEQDHRVAVLAVDPSSQQTGGSILGDKTRMERLSQNTDVFIRPSPAGKSLGGVAEQTRSTILLCEAGGYDFIIVETVGVGQSETAVHSMVDFFSLLVLPGAGDELQGIKRGVVEMADLVVVNKADGDRVALARETKRAYRNALHLFPPKPSQWTVAVMSCSALEGKGIPDIYQAVMDYKSKTVAQGYFAARRQAQALAWFQEHIQQWLSRRFWQQPEVAKEKERLEMAVQAGNISPVQAAEQLISCYTKTSMP